MLIECMWGATDSLVKGCRDNEIRNHETIMEAASPTQQVLIERSQFVNQATGHDRFVLVKVIVGESHRFRSLRICC